MNFKLTAVSANRKTGPIATSMTQASSCPNTCPFKDNGCYAAYGPAAIHWKRLNEKGDDREDFLRAVSGLRRGTMFRHNVAGDLLHVDGAIDSEFVESLAKAATHLTAFTYTHHKLTPENISVIKSSIAKGFLINSSANTAKEAVAALKEHSLPMVCVLPKDAPNVQVLDGVKVVACPAEKSDKVQCIDCKLCARDRDFVIGFRAHGTGKNKAELIAKG